MKKCRGLGIIICVLSVCMAVVALAASAQPGDNSDPIVTKSYIDKVIEDVKAYVDSKSNGGASSESTHIPASAGVSASYQVMNITKGQKVTLGEGTELILRSGNATIFATEKGGIADTTQGVDLADGEKLPQNHLMIVPRSDGRGFTAKTDCIVMLRGSYQIQ